MRGRPKAELVSRESEREQVHAWSRQDSSGVALRSRIVLSCASSPATRQQGNKVVADMLDVTLQTVKKLRRFRIHFKPTSASWLNQVERGFATLTEKQIRRGTHRSTR
jgi:hypothetical protein